MKFLMVPQNICSVTVRIVIIVVCMYGYDIRYLHDKCQQVYVCVDMIYDNLFHYLGQASII